MKKHFSSILILMLLALGGHAQMSMYGASGDVVQLSATGEVVLEYCGMLDSAKRVSYSKAIVKKTGNAVDRGEYLVIPASKLDLIYLKRLMGADTLSAHLSLMVSTDGHSRQWSTNRLYVKVLGQKTLDAALKSCEIPYISYEKAGTDPQVYAVTVRGFVDHTIAYANKLYESGKVIWAQPAFGSVPMPCSADLYSDQWGMKNTGQNSGTVGMDINVEDAWAYSTGTGTKVALIDCALDTDHPDLANNILPGTDVTDLGFGTLAQTPYEYHATHCAGIIAAEDNGMGVKGVAYNAGVIPVRAMDRYSFGNQRALDGIAAAWNSLGADILCCPWYTPKDYVAINNEIDRALTYGRNGKGSVVVFSAGNFNGAVSSPANAVAGIIVVGAVSLCGERKSPTSCDGQDWGSNYGFELDVVAPGVLISTTDITSTEGYNFDQRENDPTIPDYADFDYTNDFGGTSASCAFVSGVAALMLSANPDLTATEVEQIICETARKLPGYTYTISSSHPYGSWNEETGYGLVDAGAAVRRAWVMANGDLYVKDDASDNGVEPNTTATSYTSAPEIVLQSGGQAVGTPTAGGTYEVHVTVHNRSAVASPAGNVLRLYCAKQAGSMSWPGAWVSNPSQPNLFQSGAQTGLVGVCTLPSIAAGGTYDAVVNWTVPTQSQSPGGTGNQTYFTFGMSLLAVVEDGGLTVGIDQSGYSIDALVSHNNNVARRNITVRQDYPILPPGPILPPNPFNISISPNPAASMASVSYEMPEGVSQATLTIVSLDGQVYRTVSVDATAVDATGSIPVDVQGLPSGQYQVILSAGAYAESKTLIVY